MSRKLGRALLLRDQACKSRTIRIGVNGAKQGGARPEASEKQPGVSNYFIGADRAKWLTSIPNYSRVRYAPGTDPQTIALNISGAAHLSISPDGDLRLGDAADRVFLRRPSAYQVENGAKREVQSAFVLLADNQIGFRLGPYDSKQSLTIDPMLDY